MKQDLFTHMLKRLRDNGWMVAVHNDYRQDGEFRTFWLFTNDDGYYLKGEGKTDTEALAAVVGIAVIRGYLGG
jgi:hypothetical protein